MNRNHECRLCAKVRRAKPYGAAAASPRHSMTNTRLAIAACCSTLRSAQRTGALARQAQDRPEKRRRGGGRGAGASRRSTSCMESCPAGCPPGCCCASPGGAARAPCPTGCPSGCCCASPGAAARGLCPAGCTAGCSIAGPGTAAADAPAAAPAGTAAVTAMLAGAAPLAAGGLMRMPSASAMEGRCGVAEAGDPRPLGLSGSARRGGTGGESARRRLRRRLVRTTRKLRAGGSDEVAQVWPSREASLSSSEAGCTDSSTD